jgi:hypothetical protein
MQWFEAFKVGSDQAKVRIRFPFSIHPNFLLQLTVIHPPLPSESLSPARPAHHQVSYHGAELPAPHFLALPQDMTAQLQGRKIVIFFTENKDTVYH